MLPPPSNLVSLVKAAAQAHDIDPALACAIVEQESNWNPLAVRFEPAFEVRYENPQNLTPTEKTTRSISWGLFQLMGENARELGYKDYLSGLCDPDVGTSYGLQLLSKKLTAANGDVTKALLLWNGGSNNQYPGQVLARVSKYQDQA